MQAMNVLTNQQLAAEPLRVLTNQEIAEQPELIKKVMTRLGAVYEPPEGMQWNVCFVYHAVLSSNRRFHEFQTLLALYPNEPCDAEEEPAAAAELRERINARITDWLGIAVEPLTASQVLLLRKFMVEERMGIGISPCKESNGW